MTIEELLLDESFTDYCLNTNSIHKAKWDHIHASNAEQSLLMNEAKGLLTVISPGLSDAEVVTEVDRFKELFADLPLQNAKAPRRTWLWATAAACLATTILFFVFQPADKTVVLAVTEHTTGLGERLQIALPDGSTVILNGNSRLSYKSDFNSKERHLELSGEAFFEVAPDPAKKFIVSTQNFSSTAIGTAFYIHGRNPSASYAVDLIEGKLSVQNAAGQQTTLQAGAAATYTGRVFTIDRFDSSSLRHWIDGKLNFQEVATNEVLSQLAKWYAVDIEDLRKKRGTISITGDYSNKPLEDILKAICFSLNCTYAISENKIVIQ